MPALLTTTSMRPKARRVAATIAAAAASSATSAVNSRISALGTAARISAPASAIAPASRSTRTVLAPSSQNSRAVAAPIPPAPPVTIAALPSDVFDQLLDPALAAEVGAAYLDRTRSIEYFAALCLLIELDRRFH